MIHHNVKPHHCPPNPSPQCHSSKRHSTATPLNSAPSTKTVSPSPRLRISAFLATAYTPPPGTLGIPTFLLPVPEIVRDGVGDKSIKVWDLRSYRAPIAALNGHGYAVRKVKLLLHHRNLMVSGSYDMTVCIWDFMVEDALVGRYDHHTEFAVGVDMIVLLGDCCLVLVGMTWFTFDSMGQTPEHPNGEVFSTCSSCLSC
ncbi:hypothetical protein GH714_013021 [Hevea brasiliensis]|uniref:Peroxin-7 n=1 Tax=Hevea brasiliensis TaxID=3981 RepID=A0A6A6LPT2_HEVBR|nr:hypothetical protein GH714_013021 [Hevea brasiliensis]